MRLYGSVRDYFSYKKLEGVIVTLEQEGEVLQSVATDKKGDYALHLPYEGKLILRFAKEGYLSKFATIDTRGVPPRENAPNMRVEITLFSPIPGRDASFLNQPFGRAKYDPAVEAIMWDSVYEEAIRSTREEYLKQ